MKYIGSTLDAFKLFYEELPKKSTKVLTSLQRRRKLKSVNKAKRKDDAMAQKKKQKISKGEVAFTLFWATLLLSFIWAMTS